MRRRCFFNGLVLVTIDAQNRTKRPNTFFDETKMAPSGKTLRGSQGLSIQYLKNTEIDSPFTCVKKKKKILVFHVV